MHKLATIQIGLLLTGTFLFGVPALCTAQSDPGLEKLYRSGQYTELFNGMLHKPFSERAYHVLYLYAGIGNIPDSTAAFELVDRFRDIARREGDRELILETNLMRAFYRVQNGEYSMEKKVEIMQGIADRANTEEINHIQLRALKVIGNTYWNHQQYELAFEAYFQISELLNRLDPADFPDMARYLADIGQVHYFFQDYRQAISYFERAVALSETDYNAIEITRAKNNLGLSYRHVGELDKSDRYYREIIENRQSEGWTWWEGIARGNLGYNYYLRGDYGEAIPLIQYDLEKAVATEDFGLAAGALTWLADIRIKQNRLEEAGEQLRLAREYVGRSGQVDRLRHLYPVMSKWHAAREESELAAMYVDSTTEAIEAYNDKFNSIKLMRAQQKTDLQQRQLLIAETERELQERNLVIFIVFLLFAGSLAAYIFRSRYLMSKQQVKDLELENASRKLENARTQLDNFTRRIRENNQLISQLQKNGGNLPEQQQILRRLKSSSLLTDNDWIQFKQLFEEVHPGYLTRLRDIYPGLTPAEVRFLVLAKLKFTRKEMANILGISPKSLRVTWYRIRKKLDLQDETSAGELASRV